MAVDLSIVKDIKGITSDSRKVQPGYLFAALPGAKVDGRDFIPKAVESGAIAVLSDKDVSVSVRHLVDANPRKALSEIAAAFYGKQPETIVAVTGTNGKTSTAVFTQQLFKKLGRKSASMGTLGIGGKGVEKYGSLTTSDPVQLHSDLAGLADKGITHLAMEASSHGLDQYRLDGVKLAAGAFTNLTRDHLDYHGDMDAYFKAKARLFTELLPSGAPAILNADSAVFEKLKALCAHLNVVEFGKSAKDITLVRQDILTQGQDLTLSVRGREFHLKTKLAGHFQVMNILCALGFVLAVEDRFDAAEEILSHAETLAGPPGRLQAVAGHPQGAGIFVDYAHTPDALENALNALRPHTEKRLICIVGCGGDRDPGKRPMMAKISADLADIVIITDDNPRTEDPAEIRKQMKAGAPDAMEIGDRHAAIREGIAMLEAGDVLVIAGKGHEQGQIIGDRTLPFDDVSEAKKAIEELK